MTMTETLIKRMRDRFLCWKLPQDFRPDNGIKFELTQHQRGDYGDVARLAEWPVGTNLLDATQAEEMVRHMVGGGLTPAEMAGQIITLLQAYAKDTGCPLGGDVIQWYANHRLDMVDG